MSVPLDDPEILKLFDKGETTGVFQFDAEHQKKVVERLGVSEFDDIVLSIAISRPGSSRSGVTDSIIRRKHGKEAIEYPHESVEELLKDTYGFPVYQEQVMKMAHIAGGIPLVDTEVMRDAIKHYRHLVMAGYEEKFKQGAMERGASEKQAYDMWDMIQSASNYGFNKSHAVAYSLISYWCAYLKHYYPLEFMTACLACEPDDSEKMKKYISESRRLGLSLLPVHVNKSDMTFSIEDGKIRTGLTAIKSVGDKAATHIVENRPYRSRKHFREIVVSRKCNKKIQETLFRAGAFENRISMDCMLEHYGCWIGELPDLQELSKCKNCELYKNRKRVVPGEGNPDAQVMFIGEAPGTTEERLGRPFLRKPGSLLRQEWLSALNLTEKDCWFTYLVKCAPRGEFGEVAKPVSRHISRCSVWLESELESIKPEIVVTLGAAALKALSKTKSVKKAYGRRFDVLGHEQNMIGFALYHPAYVLDEELNVDEELAKLRELIEKKVG